MAKNREIADAGGLEAGWPPDWMTSFADVATLLMTFFIILSTLLALKIDIRYLRGVNPFTAEETVIAPDQDRALKIFTVDQKKLIEKFKMLEHQKMKEDLLDEQTKQLGKDIQQQIIKAKLEKFVEVVTSKWKVRVIPLTPFFFPPASASLRPAAQKFLDNISKFLKENPGQIRIRGHTDNLLIYTPVYRSNWELSCARATAIMRYLVDRHGIDPKRFTTVGYGPHHPADDNDTPEGRSQNRRVEIELVRTADQGVTAPEEASGERAVFPGSAPVPPVPPEETGAGESRATAS